MGQIAALKGTVAFLGRGVRKIRGAIGIGLLASVVIVAICLIIGLCSLRIVDLPGELSPKDRIAAENDILRIGIQVGGGCLVLVGFLLTAWRIKVSDRQVRSIEDGQVTERFTKAIEQLGACKADG